MFCVQRDQITSNNKLGSFKTFKYSIHGLKERVCPTGSDAWGCRQQGKPSKTMNVCVCVCDEGQRSELKWSKRISSVISDCFYNRSNPRVMELSFCLQPQMLTSFRCLYVCVLWEQTCISWETANRACSVISVMAFNGREWEHTRPRALWRPHVRTHTIQRRQHEYWE